LLPCDFKLDRDPIISRAVSVDAAAEDALAGFEIGEPAETLDQAERVGRNGSSRLGSAAREKSLEHDYNLQVYNQ
jgi:hypothetical protein